MIDENFRRKITIKLLLEQSKLGAAQTFFDPSEIIL